VLYSSVQLLPDKQGYDVPVPGDWITIAIVAEHGAFKFSKALVTIGPDNGVDNPKVGR
jgi:minichromosome maintenance protein 10